MGVENIREKQHFLKSCFLMGQHQIKSSRNGPVQIGNTRNGPVQIGNSRNGPAQNGNARNGPAQIRNSWNGPALKSLIGLAHFGNSQFGLAHFRNSLFGLAHFRNSGSGFFGMFSTPMSNFSASYSYSIRWHGYSAKIIGPKRSFLRKIGAQTFYYPLYAVATACCVPW